MPYFGSHLSIAGGLCNALDEACELKLDSVQIFTKNQQQWKVRPLADDEVRAWRSRVAEIGFADGRTVSHASYLINLASPDDELWKKSIDLMTVEVERCEALGIPFLVHHPGAFTTSTREAGLARIAAAYAEIFTRTRGFATVSCLENTVGSGSNLGAKFEELATLRSLIIDRSGRPERVGYCIDTCHAHAAGYNLSTDAGARDALDQLAAACGLENVKVLHLNDSKATCGSKRDLHAHIAEGTIGPCGFRAVLSHPGLAGRPMIMETPKGENDAGTPFDTLNLRKLRSYMPKAAPAKPSARTSSRKRAS